MADNLTFQSTTLATVPDTSVVATDDIAGVHYQRVKPDMGADGASVPVSVGAGAVGTGTQRITLGSDDPAVAVLGAISGAKVITDANGTLQQYLRGLIYLMITAANYPDKAFYGTAQTVIDTATDIAAGNFSGAPAATFDNTTDAAVPQARYALAMIELPDWAAAPVLGTTIDLYGVLKDTDGTDDDTDAPSGTSEGGGKYFGSWRVAAADAFQRRTMSIDLLGVQKVDFYIKNGTAQNLNNDGGTNCVVKITPLSYGIAA